MGTLIERVKTPLTLEEAARAVTKAWVRRTGLATPKSARIPVAQSALETGRWKFMYCFGFGNVKADPAKWPGFYQQLKCDERFSPEGARRALALATGPGQCIVEPTIGTDGKQRVILTPPHPYTCFRAFQTVEDGADDFVQLLINRYFSAVEKAMEGDAAGYSHELHLAGYYTALESVYTRNVVSLANEVEPMVTQILSSPSDPIPDELRDRVWAGMSQHFADVYYHEQEETKVS